MNSPNKFRCPQCGKFFKHKGWCCHAWTVEWIPRPQRARRATETPEVVLTPRPRRLVTQK